MLEMSAFKLFMVANLYIFNSVVDTELPVQQPTVWKNRKFELHKDWIQWVWVRKAPL